MCVEAPYLKIIIIFAVRFTNPDDTKTGTELKNFRYRGYNHFNVFLLASVYMIYLKAI